MRRGCEARVGQEIGRTQFGPDDFREFMARVAAETRLLDGWIARRECDERSYVVGFELEAWLLDHNLFPYPVNEAYLARLGSPLVVPELSRFNVELNGTPRRLGPGAFAALERELAATWTACLRTAHDLEGTLVAIGILPTIREQDLTLANISPLKRYAALNAQVLAARGGRPLAIDIEGRERLTLVHDDVMLEAATTSFQVHLQVPAAELVRHYNASVMLAAPMVAASANAPYLFERDLWDETRVPLFEQAVDCGALAPRVTFGSGYLGGNPCTPFRENVDRFAPLLPLLSDSPSAELTHLRLHNGTIWRWNRLLAGRQTGCPPHLRIEHRVMAAGPTLLDMVTNAALYVGAAHALAARMDGAETALPFAAARDNFYRAARSGLDAELVWQGGVRTRAAELLYEEIVPLAEEGLRDLGVSEAERERYLDVASARVRSGQNGAAWQRAHVARHGRDFLRLVAAYLEHQRSGMPVHEWEV